MNSLRTMMLALVALAGLACGGGGAGGPGIPPIEITTASLSDAQVGAAYSIGLSATGGDGPYTWSIDPSNPLPASLSLNNNTGIISGTPSDAESGWSGQCGVICSDGSRDAEVMLPLTITPRPEILSSQIPDAMEGAAFSYRVIGNQESFFSVAPNSDPLPAGLTLDGNTGMITGTPSAGVAGDYQVTIIASSGQTSDMRVLPMRIHAPGLAITSREFPCGQVGQAYDVLLRAIGNTAAVLWSVAPTSADQLPDGLSLNPNSGIIGGIPAIGTEGDHQVTVRASADGNSAEEVITICIGETPLIITTPALPAARVGADYVIHLHTNAGPGASLLWSVIPGKALPEGLTLSSAHGIISGQPTSAALGTQEVGIRVYDNVSKKGYDYYKAMSTHGSAALDAKLDPSEEEILHWLTRTQFSPSVEARERLNQIGFAAYVDEMLNLKASMEVEDDALEEIEDPEFPNSTQVARWMIRLMMHTNAPFQETMTLFWTDHFAMDIAAFSSQSRHYFTEKHQYLRTNFVGNLRTMLIDLSTGGAMNIWLDGISSRKGKINENYAREFWELFTLGVDNGYTQEDIEESARVFTGYRRSFDGQRDIVAFDPSRHDAENKEIFGVTIQGREGEDAWQEIIEVVDLTLETKPVARFIAKKIFEHLCYYEPSEEILDELALILRQNDWELKPMVRKILLSNAIFSAEARKGLVKSPIEYAIGLSRSAGIEPTPSWIDNQTKEAGQRITSPPDVSGWVRGTRWLSSDALVHRTNLASRLIVNVGNQEENGQSIDLALPPVGQRSAAQIVDHMLKLFHVRATAAERSKYIDYMNQEADKEGNVSDKPFDADDANLLNRKTRGLIYILAQHPTYHLR